MPSIVRHALRALVHLGFLGPLALGVFDSSFFFLPIGNDLLIIVLVARHHALFWAYCLTGAIGSTLGVFLLCLVARKLGEAGVQKMTGPRRFHYLQKKIGKRGGYFVSLAALSPPPFPFTMVVAITTALGYSQKKLLAIVFASRLLRFLIISALAVTYGRGILRVISTEAFRFTVIGFAVVCLAFSAFSIARWFSTSKGGRGQPAAA